MASPVTAATVYPADSTSYEWLINDWDAGSNQNVNVQGSYLVELQPNGFYGVYPKHVLAQLPAGAKSVAVVAADSGEELEEVDETVPPGAGQYRVSPIQGAIEFSSASNGRVYTIKYVSSGTANRKAGFLASGYFDSGTRRLAKLKILTIPDGTNYVVSEHGIVYAKSQNRIVNVRTGYSRNVGSGGFIRESTSASLHIYRAEWNDETITIRRGSSSIGSDWIYNCLIIYKEL